MNKIKAGIVSFTDPRAVKGIKKIDKYNLDCQNRLSEAFRQQGFEVVTPLGDGLVRSRASSQQAAAALLAADVDALLLGCWKWTDPMLAVDIVRQVVRPACLVGESDPSSTALGCMAAVGAALWEIAPNACALRHGRAMNAPGGNFDIAVRWARGAGALSQLRRSALLLWGGSYCLKMAHLDDDPSRLKSFIVGDILVEDQLVLAQGADVLLAKSKKRVDAFVKWLEKGGAGVRYDGGMLTPESLRRQAALYLAARDRLAELEGEGVAGVSVKCQPALSEQWGATACMLPAFLPFGEDSEGARPVIAATCEGDIKGLITSALLQNIAGVPAGFGDIRAIDLQGRPHLIISNCGAASVYYAALKSNAADTLPALTLRGQCQGASGAAVGYASPAFGCATIARLVRRQGRYAMQYAFADSRAAAPELIARLGWGDSWPISVFDINMDLQRFTVAAASNHYSFVPGDFVQELLSVCAELDLPVECLNG